jgi:hypothetical protein
VGDERQKFLASLIFGTRDRNIFRNLSPLILEIEIEIYLEIVASLILEIEIEIYASLILEIRDRDSDRDI